MDTKVDFGESVFAAWHEAVYSSLTAAVLEVAQIITCICGN